MDMLVKDMIKHKPLVYNEGEATQDMTEKKAANNRQMTIQLQQTSRVCLLILSQFCISLKLKYEEGLVLFRWYVIYR